MNRIKDYVQLHLNIFLFSITGVLSKIASIYYNQDGIKSPMLYLFIFLMFLNCGIYAIAWQRVIKKFELNVAYANKTVSLLWSQVWAVLIFHENLRWVNVLGLSIILIGVLVVQKYE